ncbi:MAG: hypothetical protein LJE69_10920 [Thiohalocapsa sp.]|jgi:hypothetical protein|uniref:hypothetical protein n=1 Tax=Thiohalocapsa sp. TaxID=2497641 RepID=UPI00260009A2|nr:hypothetical protein [Thiohalocapsa sp.]MCG6941745.1 hypothetical protein [Thiohalocapsa sp.]
MKAYDITQRLPDTAADSIVRQGAEEAALESHLLALQEQYDTIQRAGADALRVAETQLQMARTLVGLGRGEQAWSIAREAFDAFMTLEEIESAADCCDVLFRAEQPQSLAALGQGIWLAVTCPIDVELAVDLLNHVVDETPNDADGAAVAATTALFLADLRAEGTQRENLVFFTSQMLSSVARRHSDVDSQEAFDLWRDRLELREPEKFLVRLRNVIDVLVQDDWWFDREALQERLPA